MGEGDSSTGSPRILLKMPNWVGDCVMATPAIAALRRTFPQARLDALARRGPAGVLFDNPDLSSVIAADDRRLGSEQRERLRAARYDAVALFPNSLRSAWSAWRLGIGKRIGFARGGRRLLLTHPIAFDPRRWQTPTPRPLSKKSIRADAPSPRSLPSEQAPPGHMVHYYLRIAEETSRALGRPLLKDSNVSLVLETGADTRAHVDSLLARHGLAGRLLIGLNPGAAYGDAKRYPLSQLGAAASLLLPKAEESGQPPAFVSTAAPGEAHLNDELAQHLDAPLYRLGEELDLRGLAGLLDRLSLLITNDSGAMHMAAARGIPTLALFGPTDWNVTRPWSPAARVLRQSPFCAPCFLRECPIDHRCMREITPESVAAASADLLRGAGD